MLLSAEACYRKWGHHAHLGCFANECGVPGIWTTSKAGDGVQTGYDLPVVKMIKDAVSAEVVASGGAGNLEHFHQAAEAGGTILLAASVFHFGTIVIGDLKDYLRNRGVAVR